MHRTLSILEIIEKVFDHLKDLEPGQYYVRWERDHAVLARTCKTFRDPALDALWKVQNTLNHILNCLPPDVWEEQPVRWSRRAKILKKRTLDPGDWENALKYSRRVRVLEMPALNFPDDSVLEAIGSCFSQEPLFPNLRRLVWDPEPDSLSFQYVRLFLCPKITQLYLAVPLVADIVFLASMSLNLPELEEFGLFFPATEDSLVSRTSSLLALQLSKIEQLVLDTPDVRALLHLSRLPTLRKITLSMRDLEQSPIERVDLYQFPALETLHLCDIGLERATAFINSMSDSHLRVFSATTRVLETQHSTGQLYATIALHVNHFTLTSLDIGTGNEFMATIRAPRPISTAGYVVDSRTLEPLFQFHNLTTVTLQPPVGFTIDDTTAWEMARAWPKIETLELASGSTFHHPPSMTLRGLRAFASHCPELVTLKIAFDASETPQFDDSPESRISQHELDDLDVSISPISNPANLARFLSALFPSLTDLHTVDEWRWDHEEYQEEDNDEGIVAAREHHEQWMRVKELVPIFAAVRVEERLRAKTATSTE